MSSDEATGQRAEPSGRTRTPLLPVLSWFALLASIAAIFLPSTVVAPPLQGALPVACAAVGFAMAGIELTSKEETDRLADSAFLANAALLSLLFAIAFVWWAT